MKEEIWKDIPNYEGLYQASNLGRIRSLDRVIHTRDGKSCPREGVILKFFKSVDGYMQCNLYVNGIKRNYFVHQLVTMAFLNHEPNGHSLVVDHINGKKDDNRLENLQVVTNRHNATKDTRGTSQYMGVGWCNQTKKWRARIYINGKTIYLGCFTDESEAGLAYQKALDSINNQNIK